MASPTARRGNTMPVGELRSRWWIGIILLVSGCIVYVLQHVLLPFVLAFLGAYILLPVINVLERRLHLPRLVIVLLVFFAAGAPCALLAYADGRSLFNRGARFAAELPALIERVVATVFQGKTIHIMGTAITAESVAGDLSRGVNQILSQPAGVLGIAGGGIAIFVGIVLSVVVLFYLLVSVRSFPEALMRMAPPGPHPRLRHFAGRIDALIGRYLRGVFLVVLFQGVASYVALRWAIGLPHAALAAILAALLEPLPAIGPVLAIAAVGMLALAVTDVWTTLAALAVLLGLRLLIDNVIGPLLLGWAVRLHPVIVIFAFVVGVSVFGIVGLVLAIPAAATIRLLIEEWDTAPGDESRNVKRIA